MHSAKDMSAVLPDGLDIAAVLPREDPRDALVLRAAARRVDFDAALAHLGEMPAIGTGSVRRIAQLAAVLPQATFAPIRGNVDTRLRKLDDGDYDALVLAAAGMRRLGLGARISAAIPVDVCIPAPGQGIVAIEIRADDRARARRGGRRDDRARRCLACGRARDGHGARRRLPAAARRDRGARSRRPDDARGRRDAGRPPAIRRDASRAVRRSRLRSAAAAGATTLASAGCRGPFSMTAVRATNP